MAGVDGILISRDGKMLSKKLFTSLRFRKADSSTLSVIFSSPTPHKFFNEYNLHDCLQTSGWSTKYAVDERGDALLGVGVSTSVVNSLKLVNALLHFDHERIHFELELLKMLAPSAGLRQL